jgi:DNA-binding beta-propeller fold protein YncE/tRNA A-37 threonylcarbamoyl transferase component Bud32
VSEQTPPAAGGFGVGSHIAGYRLDEQIGRGGMAVVYRAHDPRLDRRVALKILAPELASDEEFRQRFIRESRAAAAVDHPNIIPLYEAGEADGVLFIAMRFVDGRDVQTLIHQQAPLPVARVCDIVTQVASALDAAHAHGLVHRDVKPGNMLRDATSGRAQPDHVYLSDFGLSKQSLGTSAALTAVGQFLGTLNYVAPEQIEGRPVDGRTDEYALACSAFEMLAGQTPFRRGDSLAIMWAQLSDAPPSLTGIRRDLPAAVDGVMARALSKAPDDRYGTCLEFATALRQACGVRTGSTAPGKIEPGAGATRAVRPDELAAASGAAAASAAGGQPPGQPAATGRADASAPAAGAPKGGAADAGATRTGMVPARPGGASGSGPARGGQPTEAHRIPGVRPTKPGLTDPMGDYGQPYAPPAAPPARRSRRTLAVVLAACVVVAAAGGAYLLLGRGGGGGGGGTGGGQTGTATRVLTLPGCTTAIARVAPLTNVRTHFVQVGGKPFDVVVSPNNFGFVSLRNNAPLVVMNTTKFVPTVVQQVPLANPEGEAFTHNRQYLLVAGDSGLTVFRVRDLEAGLTTPVGSLTSPGGKGALQVVPSPDDKFAFVAMQNSGNVAVFNLHKALTAGFGPADFVGMIPMRSDPTGMAASPDGRYLYVVNGLAGTALQSGMGTLAIVDMRKAETSPGSSVVKEDNAGCGPARVLASPDGKYVWVTSGGGNALEAFSAAKLLSDSRHALVAKVEVGQVPLGLALISNGTRMVVADSNRDSVGTSTADLMVVDVGKALAGKPALVGTIKSGLAPRQFALEPDGKTLLVTNTSSGQVEAVNVGHIP